MRPVSCCSGSIAAIEHLRFETPDSATQDGLLTFVVIGGGPTGVELAGILPTLARKGFRRDFRRLDLTEVRIVLLEGGPRLLPAFPETLSARAYRDVEELGVTCRAGAVVTCVTRREGKLPTAHVWWNDRAP